MSTWVWKNKTIAQWDAGIVSFETAVDTHADALTVEEGARGALAEALDRLHEKTKLCVGVAKAEFSADPTKRAAFAPLTAPRTSTDARLHAAQALASAWEQHAPTWEPTPGLTLTAYNALRTEVSSKRQTLEQAIATTREKNAQLGALAKSLDKEAKTWFAVATRLYPENTPEGKLLRAELP